MRRDCSRAAFASAPVLVAGRPAAARSVACRPRRRGARRRRRAAARARRWRQRRRLCRGAVCEVASRRSAAERRRLRREERSVRRRRPVSRVLSDGRARTPIARRRPGRPDGHFSRSAVARTLEQPTRGCAGDRLPAGSRRAASRRIFGLAPAGVYPATPVARRAVRSYRTFSPLPDSFGLAPSGPSAVCFLWHCPSHPRECAQALPGNPPCGARTFLDRPLLAEPVSRPSGRRRRTEEI